MIEIRFAVKEDIEELMRIRLEMLREVNSLPEDASFSEKLVSMSREYFESGDDATVLAFDGSRAVACASLSFIRIMPTYGHPTGKRAHLMNVYTNPSYRRQGLARKMLDMLISLARERGVTEISLDATEAGRPLYESAGFGSNHEAMNLILEVPPED
ncbi:MAG: GNAT family N-acetyltransferase [Clostridiales bacterium]|nr:GNAT family N-acetyltransferase [Clostridiales bacterium]